MALNNLPTVGIAGTGIAAKVAARQIYARCDAENLVPPEIHFFDAHKDPGGRTKSYVFHSPTGPIVLDEQAHWFHRGYDNRFYQYLVGQIEQVSRQFGIKNISEIFYHDEANPKIFLERPGKMVQMFRDAAWELVEQMCEKLQAMNPLVDPSLGAVGDKIMHSFAARELRLLSTWTGVLPHSASMAELMADPSTSGGLIVKGGIAMPVGLLDKYLQSRGAHYHMDTRITAITNNGGHCAFTDHRGKEYAFDESIVTFSPGVLQHAVEHGSIQFCGRHPWQLIEALKDLVMANMAKLTIANDDLQVDGRIYFERDGRQGFLNTLPGFAPTIIMGGPGAVEVEEMNENERFELVDGLMRDLGQSDPYLTPAHIHCTDANKNSLTRGAYSILKPGGKRRDFIQDGSVAYGGEGFVQSEYSPGTMEGAHKSGMDMGNVHFVKLRPRLPRRPSPPETGAKWKLAA